ncbi:MAG: hypothetical protein ACFFD4_30975 [Candidatus Odinarchaeota archaeon]
MAIAVDSKKSNQENVSFLKPTDEMIRFWKFYIKRKVVFFKDAPPLCWLITSEEQVFLKSFAVLDHDTLMSQTDYLRLADILETYRDAWKKLERLLNELMAKLDRKRDERMKNIIRKD